MGYIKYNANPCDVHDIDCTVRALSVLLDSTWDDIYWELCMLGYKMCRMPSSVSVINEFLYNEGYNRYAIPNTCPYCYSVSEFARDNPSGHFLLCTDSHVVPIINGNYIDTWDSGLETGLYYWVKEEE